MGYKKSFNLVTLQLIIPLSTMTKAEYKNAYGIDLDDIDIEKVTLLQDEGSKNKYFVDEVKTTESGVDIYAGGKILSIGESSVSVVVGAYSVDNAKPIYCHPITITSEILEGVGIQTRLQLLIFNNSSTPITSDSFLSFVKGMLDNGAILMVNGYVLDSGVYCDAYNIQKVASEYSCYFFNPSAGRSRVSLDIIVAGEFSINDGVNKIN